MQFLYNGRTEIPQDLVNELLYVAKDLSIKGLEEENKSEPILYTDIPQNTLSTEPKPNVTGKKKPSSNKTKCKLCHFVGRNQDSLDRHTNIVHPDSKTKEDEHLDSIECIIESDTDNSHEEPEATERNDLAVSSLDDTNINTDGQKIFRPEDVIKIQPGTLCWKFFHFKGQKKGDGKQKYFNKYSQVWGKEIPNRERAYCNICGKSLAYGGTTGSLSTHMKHKHQRVWEEAENARRERLDSLDRHEIIVHPDSETTDSDIMKTETDDLIEELCESVDERNDLAVSLLEDTNVNIDGGKKISPEDVINAKPGTLCWKFFHFREQKKEDGKRILEREKVYCNICEKSLAYGGTTSTLNGHMRHIHQKLWEEALNAQKGKNH